MKRYTWFIATFSILPVMVIAGVMMLVFFGKSEQGPTDAEGIDKDFQLYLEVRQRLIDHYDGEIDETELRNEALKGMAVATGDRYTRVLTPIQAQDQDRNLGGSFFGIGVGVRPNDDGSIRVTGVDPGSGAEKAGILPDDVIVAVDGESIIDREYENSVQRIMGKEEGSLVIITVLRGGEPTDGTDQSAERITVNVYRVRVVSRSVHDAHIEDHEGRRFGYVHVSDFNTNTFDPQFTDALAELTANGAEGIIIDMRGNGGGKVDVAAEFVDGLIAEKDELIVFTHSGREENRKNDRVYKTKDEEALTDLPVIVLVDRNSASATEIVTGALKDHGRAFVIGERTFGKGLVQTIFKLKTDPNYTVNITTSQYFTPLGRQVQNGKDGEPGGILPDLQIEYKDGEESRVRARMNARQARHNREEIAETSDWWNYEDRMLEAALDVLSGKAVSVGD